MNTLLAISIAALLFLILFGGLEFGFRIGRRAKEEGDGLSGGQVGAIQGALLGLLGLLLAFSFAAAGTRFLDRQDLIVTEANAIGTAYLRADLLDDPFRSELRTALRDYTQRRIYWSGQLRHGFPAEAAQEFDKLHTRIWSAARDGASAKPATILAVLNPVNELIDLHSLRIAAGRKHLPIPVLALLIVCSVLSIGVIGVGCGLGNHRRTRLTIPLTLLITCALWITIDLDHPRAGLLQLSDAPLKDLKF